MRIFILALGIFSVAAIAEYATYGDVYLNGLARENSWGLNPKGEHQAMVCNVNGPDGYLSVRSGPGTNHRIERNLERLAILSVDTRYREGRWVYVNTAYRTHDRHGRRLAEVADLHVSGWAHDGYLCDFLD